MMSDDEKHLRSLLRVKQRRLQELENQRAHLGYHAPPHVVLEIQDIQQEVTTIKRKLRDIGLKKSSPSNQIGYQQIPYSSEIEHAIADYKLKLEELERQAKLSYGGEAFAPLPIKAKIELVRDELRRLGAITDDYDR